VAHGDGVRARRERQKGGNRHAFLNREIHDLPLKDVELEHPPHEKKGNRGHDDIADPLPGGPPCGSPRKGFEQFSCHLGACP
jgi:hypothetical protein